MSGYWFYNEKKIINTDEKTGDKFMSIIVDAGGLSCPQPVLMTLNKIKEIKKGKIIIKVDSNTSKENVSRAAQSQGWDIDIQEQETGYQLTIKKE